MKKLLFASAAAAMTLFPGAAVASVYNATVATVAVAYCRYSLGYNTMDEVISLSSRYLVNEGYSSSAINRAMDSPSFDDDVVEAIRIGGGCEKIVN